MKFSRLLACSAVAMLATGAFADAANVLISFSTEADYYADGSAVKNGEWYALCWSADEVFDGLALDCTPVNKDEKVLILAPLAKDGRCPYTLFQVDSKEAPQGGNYFVYLLDTRSADGATETVAKATVDEETGRRVPEGAVNGSAAAKSYTASASIGSNVAGEGTAAGAGAAWSAVQPRITAFKVENAKVEITVSGLMKGVGYNVKMGETPSSLISYGFTTPKADASGTATFVLEPKDAKFFKVVAE